MFELALLVILVVLVVAALKGGRHKMQQTPVVVHVPGEFHITFAPQLTQARAFIEQIVSNYKRSDSLADELPTQFFKVDYHDGQAPALTFYLLAVSIRGGMLYFQAINPQPLLGDNDSHLNQLKLYSEAVLELHPLSHSAGVEAIIQLNEAVESAAAQFNLNVSPLIDSD
jgi:hypothetical protein